MASNYTSTLYITSARLARGYVEAWLESETDTTATIGWRIVCQQKSAALYGQTATCSVDGTERGSCSGYITSSSSSWKDVCSESGTTTVSKTKSARNVPITVKTRVEPVSGYGSVTTDYASATVNIPIKAITSYAVTYDANTTDAVGNLPSGQTKYHGESLDLTKATPTREGYIFLGWSTSSTAITADSAYAPGSAYTGNAALDLYAVWELAYHVPIISAAAVGRCDKDGNADDYGAYALVTFSWQTDDGFGATIASASVALEGGSSVAATVTGTNAGTGRAVVGGSLSSETSYKVTISVTDSEGGTGTASGVIPAVMFPIDFLGNGKGVAFGMPASREGYADFGYKLAIDGIDVDLIQQATFYSTAANADETATAWVTTALDEVKAATDGFDEVATFKSGVVTFLKDGCYELSGSIYWSGSATSGGVGIFNGDVEESSAFFTGDMSQITAVLMPTIVNVTAGETRIFKRRCVAGAYMRYGIYSWLTIKYLGTGGSLIGGSGESAGASGAYLPLTGGVMTGSITNADGNSYKFTSEAGMRGNSSGALILSSVNDQGVYLRPNGSSGSDGVVVKAAGLLPEASGAMALGADDRRFQQVFGREYYFDNADAAYSSAYKFGMYQWQDNFTFVTRNAANTHLLDAWQIAGATGVTNFLVRPTLNGAGLATQSEIPSLSGYMPKSGGTFTGNIVVNVAGNPYLELMESGTGKIFYIQAYDSGDGKGVRAAIGPTFSKSLQVDVNGNIYMLGANRPTWNGSNMALQSDVPTVPTNVSAFTNDAGYLTAHQDLSGYAKLQTYNNFLHDNNEFTIVPDAYSGDVFWNYRTGSGNLNGNIGGYRFCNGKGGTAGVTLYADAFSGTAARATADGSGNNIVSTYMPKTGGRFTGPISFQSESLPSKALEYITGIDAFANGGELGWQSKADFLAGYATQSWVTTQISNASISGGSVDLSDYARLSVANTYNGEQKFQNSSYCPTVTDTASGVGCAFKASRGLVNEMLVDKLIMTASTGKLPVYKYSGTSGGAMSSLAEVGNISTDGIWSGGAVKDGNGNNIASTYLPKSGGTMSGPLVLTGGDAASGVGNMQLDTNGQITAKGTTATLFGRTNATTLLLGHSSHSLGLRGSAARPTYNGSNMALQSEVLRPTVLYDNSAGTTGTITLAETAANFSYMEIFFMTNDSEHQSVRIASPNGKVATLSQIKPRDVDAVYLKAMNVLVSGTTITQDTTNAVSAEYNFFAGGTVGFYQRYHILVTKVVGYK